MLRKILLLTLSLILFSSCYYDNEEELYQNINNNANCDTMNLTYTANIEAIVSSNCAISGCHSQPSPTAGLDLSQFQEVKRVAGNGQLTNRITSTGPDVMPPPAQTPLSNCKINQIVQWVQDGAPEN